MIDFAYILKIFGCKSKIKRARELFAELEEQSQNLSTADPLSTSIRPELRIRATAPQHQKQEDKKKPAPAGIDAAAKQEASYLKSEIDLYKVLAQLFKVDEFEAFCKEKVP